MRGRSVLRALLFLSALAQPSEASPGIRLAFYGWESQPVGCFDETDPNPPDEVALDLEALVGPEFGGSRYYFGVRSHSLPAYGCELADTEPAEGCGGYDVTLWFEPGSVVIGHMTPSDQNCTISGEHWDGRRPTDFTSIRVEFVDGPPCSGSRELWIPVRWVQPAPPYLWVPDLAGGTVSRVDLATRSVDAVVDVGIGPAGIAVGDELVVVTHRWSPQVYRISRATAAVVDSIDLSAHMAFGIAVAVTADDVAYVVGRLHAESPETDMAVLAKITRGGFVTSTPLVQIQGDTNPGDPLLPLDCIGIGLGAGKAYIPWSRSWDGGTGVLVADLTDLSFVTLELSPSQYGYLGPGVGVASDGSSRLAATRLERRTLISVQPSADLESIPIPCTGNDRRDVRVRAEDAVTIAFGEGDDRFAGRTEGLWNCLPAESSYPAGLAHDADGVLWAAFPDEGVVRSFDESGMEIGSPIPIGGIPIGYGDMSGLEVGEPILTGACCLPNGACVVLTRSECEPDGVWQGGGTACDPNPCGGACCSVLDCGTCILATSEAECEGLGVEWVFAGYGTDCDPAPCSEAGACCSPSGCAIVDCQACVTLTGYGFMGPGTSCDPNPCHTSSVDGTDTGDSVSLWAWPNPAPGETDVGFSIPTDGHVALDLLDVSGRAIRTLTAAAFEGGRHRITWDGRTASGRPAPAGVYWIRLQSGGRVATAQLLLLR